jgi:hypothetical protein
VRGADAVNRAAVGRVHITGDIRTKRAMPVPSTDPSTYRPANKKRAQVRPGRCGLDDRLGESVRFGSRIRMPGEDWLYIDDGRCIYSFKWPNSQTIPGNFQHGYKV